MNEEIISPAYDTGQQAEQLQQAEPEGKPALSAKAYLNEVRNIDRQINSKVATLERLKNLATSTSMAISDMPKAHNVTSRMANAVSKIVDLEREIGTDMEVYLELKVEATRQIALITDPKYRYVLTERYINNHTWENIAFGLECSVRYALKLNGLALRAFKVPEDSVLLRR